MTKRLFFVLPIIVVMVALAVPAEAVTLPNICAKWVACGNGAYYCAANRGESCAHPSFVVTRTLENWSQKQATATKVTKGATVKSAPSKYVYRYVTKRVCTKNSKGRYVCKNKRVLTKVLRRR